ncbi:MAG: hypothetical protein RR475_03920 [Clostridia bacterium]
MRTTVDAKVDCGQARIVQNLGTLLVPQIARTTVGHFIILADEFGRSRHVMYFDGGHFQCVSQTAVGLYADVSLHTEAPFVALFA